MQKLDVLSDGPFRYIHSTETGQLLTTLVKERNSNLRLTGKFVEEEGEDAPIGRTLRQWKAIIARRVEKRETHSLMIGAEQRGNMYLAYANKASELGDKELADRLYEKGLYWLDRYNKFAGNN